MTLFPTVFHPRPLVASPRVRSSLVSHPPLRTHSLRPDMTRRRFMNVRTYAVTTTSRWPSPPGASVSSTSSTSRRPRGTVTVASTATGKGVCGGRCPNAPRPSPDTFLVAEGIILGWSDLETFPYESVPPHRTGPSIQR